MAGGGVGGAAGGGVGTTTGGTDGCAAGGCAAGAPCLPTPSRLPWQAVTSPAASSRATVPAPVSGNRRSEFFERDLGAGRCVFATVPFQWLKVGGGAPRKFTWEPLLTRCLKWILQYVSISDSSDDLTPPVLTTNQYHVRAKTNHPCGEISSIALFRCIRL